MLPGERLLQPDRALVVDEPVQPHARDARIQVRLRVVDARLRGLRLDHLHALPVFLRDEAAEREPFRVPADLHVHRVGAQEVHHLAPCQRTFLKTLESKAAVGITYFPGPKYTTPPPFS